MRDTLPDPSDGVPAGVAASVGPLQSLEGSKAHRHLKSGYQTSKALVHVKPLFPISL